MLVMYDLELPLQPLKAVHGARADEPLQGSLGLKTRGTQEPYDEIYF